MLLKVAWDEEKNRKTSCDLCAIRCERFFALLGRVQKILARGKKKLANESYEWTEAHYLIHTNWYHRVAACSRSQYTSPTEKRDHFGNEWTSVARNIKAYQNLSPWPSPHLPLDGKQKVVYTIINIIQPARRRSGRTKKPPQVFISLVNRRWKWNIALDMFTKWMKKKLRPNTAKIQIEILFMRLLSYYCWSIWLRFSSVNVSQRGTYRLAGVIIRKRFVKEFTWSIESF